MFALNTKFSQ